MALSSEQWHDRFQVQASWTRAYRSHFFEQLDLAQSDRILDIGCGTGALFADLTSHTTGSVFGADINLEHLELSAEVSGIHLLGGDVHRLPFADRCFDLVICHYFLMWTGDPFHALMEMKRVTRSGGIVAAFAEPDYGGRIDFPIEFIQLRELQIEGLIRSGADPMQGRKLRTIFSSAGLSIQEWGVYQGAWQGGQTPEEIDSEWMVLREDLQGQLSKIEIAALEKHDRQARESGSRLVYVPTFYCWGIAP